jgi:uncharacterized protein (TIGR02145 family)
MKKLLLAGFISGFLSISLNSSAQDYQITFAGAGAATLIDSVEVENLSTGKTITLNGGDILRLTSVVGISQPEKINSSGMRIYPNPMLDNSILALHPPEAGDAVIIVYEMTGKTVAKIHTYLENGRQEFRLSGLKNGMYLINVTGNSFQYSGKILSNGKADGNPGIEKVSNTAESRVEKISKKEFVIAQGTVDMPYTPGDRLKFKAISGIYSTVKTDIPTENKTLRFNFIPCTDGDNNNYGVVEIGSQIWMAENLKTIKNINGELIGTTIPDTLDISGESDPAYQWAYQGNESNVASFGRLYTWYAASNACPTGWHVPSGDDWYLLTSYLGESEAGSYLKEMGKTHWMEPNIKANNQTGFTALPGGIRDINGSFVSIGSDGEWWSYQCQRSCYTMGMQMGYDFSDVQGIHPFDGKYGFSVRCLSDSVKTIPSLYTRDATDITLISAISGGEITDDWGCPVTSRGICWSSIHTPTLEDTLTSDGTGAGAFTSSVTGLQPNQTYFIRAYATNSQGTAYGNMITFKTLSLWPTLSTTPITNITSTSATSGGEITNIGESNVTVRGVCWSSLHTPTVSDSLTSDGTGIGIFASSITGLQPNLTYYIRAYATNNDGTGYGDLIAFTTFPPWPTLSTTPITNITSTSATSGGEITNIGASNVTVRGVCFSSLHTPTISDSVTSDGSGSGAFTSSLADLQPNLTYYIRAYAVNGHGTAYGEQVILKTMTGQISDIDNNTYYTVTIGTQVWMAENLKTTKFKNGTLIPFIEETDTGWYWLSTPGYCWYNYDPDNIKVPYGALYNWYVVNTGNLCPTGWHVPSDDEWKTLEMYLNMTQDEAGGTGWRGTDQGTQLKNTSGWNEGGNGTNTGGFTALPGGIGYSGGEFYGNGSHGFWWSTSENNTTDAWCRSLHCQQGNVNRTYYPKLYVFSVRCLKD